MDKFAFVDFQIYMLCIIYTVYIYNAMYKFSDIFINLQNVLTL